MLKLVGSQCRRFVIWSCLRQPDMKSTWVPRYELMLMSSGTFLFDAFMGLEADCSHSPSRPGGPHIATSRHDLSGTPLKKHNTQATLLIRIVDLCSSFCLSPGYAAEASEAYPPYFRATRSISLPYLLMCSRHITSVH